MNHYGRLIAKNKEELSSLEQFAEKHRAIYDDHYVYMAVMIRIDEVQGQIDWLCAQNDQFKKDTGTSENALS